MKKYEYIIIIFQIIIMDEYRDLLIMKNKLNNEKNLMEKVELLNNGEVYKIVINMLNDITLKINKYAEEKKNLYLKNIDEMKTIINIINNDFDINNFKYVENIINIEIEKINKLIKNIDKEIEKINNNIL